MNQTEISVKDFLLICYPEILYPEIEMSASFCRQDHERIKTHNYKK